MLELRGVYRAIFLTAIQFDAVIALKIYTA